MKGSAGTRIGDRKDAVKTCFDEWRMQRGALQCHIDGKALVRNFLAAGVALFEEPAGDAGQQEVDEVRRDAPDGMPGLLKMSKNLFALGWTEYDVLARLGLDDQEFEVQLVRDESQAASVRTEEVAKGAGVGLEIGMCDDGIAVQGLVMGHAAARSNALRKDDVLLEIDGRFVGNDPDEVARQLRGVWGTTVALKLKRSTARVLLVHRQRILSRLVATMKPLRKVMIVLMRTCALRAQQFRDEDVHGVRSASFNMFHYNADAGTGLIAKMQLDPRMSDLLHNLELRLFGSSSLSALNTYVLNVLALMPEEDSLRLSQHQQRAAASAARR